MFVPRVKACQAVHQNSRVIGCSRALTFGRLPLTYTAKRS